MPDSYRTDCLHFQWDRPCTWHKRDSRECPGCDRYTPVGPMILIVKLAALGDVLRTTCLLEPLHRAYQDPFITWVTLPEAVPLLENNPLIQEVWSTDTLGYLRLRSRPFDLVLSPDSHPDSAMLASLPRAREKRGFIWDQDSNRILLQGEGDQRLFDLSHKDRLKKANQRTYQELILDVCGLGSNGFGRIIFQPRPQELASARRLLSIEQEGNPPRRRLNLAFVTGAGERWEKKAWIPEYYVHLARWFLAQEPEAHIFLLGGNSEDHTNSAIMRGVADSARLSKINTAASLRIFGAVFHFMDLVVTGDTLGLHLALAAGKRVVCLVGPTSGPELELYGLGRTIVSPIDCACCYQTSCTVKPSCMELITPELVLAEARRQLNLARGRGASQ